MDDDYDLTGLTLHGVPLADVLGGSPEPVEEGASPGVVTGGAGLVREERQVRIVEQPLTRLNLGSPKSFLKIIQNVVESGEQFAIVWNEERMSLVMRDRSFVVSYYPEFTGAARLFLVLKERQKRTLFGQPSGPTIWDYEFQPAKFEKRELIDFLKTYVEGSNLPKEFVEAVRHTKVTATQDSFDEAVDLEDGRVDRTGTETTIRTNIPPFIRLMLPLTREFTAAMEFKVWVGPDVDAYGHPIKNTQRYYLQCTNIRRCLQQLALTVLDALPEGVDKDNVYYGSLEVEGRG